MSGAEIAIALAAASAVVSAAGAIQQGQASRKMANYQATVAENNAIAARQEAEFQERQHREKARQALSAHRARAAKGGALPEEGSPLLFGVDTSEASEIDALNIRRRGELQATELRSRAALTRYEGRMAQRSAYLRAGSSLLDGMSRAAGSMKS